MPGRASLVLLTHVRDPGNAGTVIRGGRRRRRRRRPRQRGSGRRPRAKVVRSTAGSLFHLPVVTGLTSPATLQRLRGAGIRVLAADGVGDARCCPTPTCSVPHCLGLRQRGLGADERRARRVRRGRPGADPRPGRVAQPRDGRHGLPVRVGGPAPIRRPSATVACATCRESFDVPDDLAANGLPSSSPTASSPPIGADATVRFMQLARRADHRPGRAATSSAATSARRCPCRTRDGTSWWDFDRPVAGPAHPHRAPRAAALLPHRPRAARHRAVRARRGPGSRCAPWSLALRDAEARRRAETEHAALHLDGGPRAAFAADLGQGVLARPCCAGGTGSPTTRSA